MQSTNKICLISRKNLAGTKRDTDRLGRPMTQVSGKLIHTNGLGARQLRTNDDDLHLPTT